MKNLNQLLIKVAASLITVAALGMSLAVPVKAQQSGQQCVIVYGIEFCSEKTPFVTPFGVIDDATMIVLMAIFAGVFMVVLNAAYIKSRLNQVS